MTGIDRSTCPTPIAKGAPEIVPALLIGRLATDTRFEGLGLGTAMVGALLAEAVTLNRTAAFRAVVVTALNDAAYEWWQRFGFAPFDPDDETRLDLFLLTKDIEATLQHMVSRTAVAAPVPAEFTLLDAAQLAALPSELRAAYEELRAMDPVERARFLGHTTLASTAQAFLASVCDAQDLRTVWPGVDENLRLCLVQQWILDNATNFWTDGHDRDETAHALAAAEPNHPLWEHFERVHLRSISKSIPPPAVRGIGANTRLVSPDAELLYIQDITDMEGGVWLPGEEREVYPMVMKRTDNRWLVASLGSENLPVPGWPPQF